ncbi:Hsp20/alpha crystallin family protein [Haloechinothrix salitolerans]|uniref:Hsp20/alpha crystallin family protein n=1 Tax=Haloechinothrix salitolerans TaxID=926830 RepID=A0ABW2CAF9_9PSEU
MTSLMHRPKFTFADPFEWLEQSWPFAATEHAIRIEESMKDDVYLVRAELPGFDPDSDIHVTAENGVLTIIAKRESRESSNGHSEFRYGSFTRSRTLPAGADADKITAEYTNGILEVTVPCGGKQESAQVPIKIAKR